MKFFCFAALILILSGFFFSAQAHPSWALVVDDREQIYFSDLSKIWKIDRDGKISVFKEIHTHELRLDREGNLLGEELNYNPSNGELKSGLWKFTTDNQFSYTLPLTAAPPKGISIWKNSEGATYYCGQTETEPREYFLLKREANGNVKVLFGDRRRALEQRQTVPYSIGGLAFGADESVYFKNSTAIWKADKNDLVSVVAAPNQFAEISSNPMLFGLSLDAENNVYTADYNGRKVLKIAPDKKISVVVQSEKSWAPTGVYWKNKNLYLMEVEVLPSGAQGAFQIRKIEPNGKITIVGKIGEPQERNQMAENSMNAPPDNQNSNKAREKPCLGIGLICLAITILAKRK